MPTSRKSLELDAGRVFRWSFLPVFLALEWAVWEHVRRLVVRRPGFRLFILLLAPWATRRAVFYATIVAGTLTLAGVLFVRLVLSPLLKLWLSPASDPSAWMFHLSAGESAEASVPARMRAEGGWQPGSLVLTGGRIWFLPAAWGPEPWSLSRSELERVEAVAPGFARFLPVRHWPAHLRLTGRSGDQARLAVADPDAVLGWFVPPRGVALVGRPRAVPEGVFDA